MAVNGRMPLRRPLVVLAFVLATVLGAAPAIANGLISGTDQVPPLLLRAGRVLGAKGYSLWRHVVLPASLPTGKMSVPGGSPRYPIVERTPPAREIPSVPAATRPCPKGRRAG